jgi:hypothetical protein
MGNPFPRINRNAFATSGRPRHVEDPGHGAGSSALFKPTEIPMTGSKPRARPVFVYILVVVLPATIAGCAKSGTVAGKASVDGQPVNGGSVSFLGADVELGTRNSSTGNIQADGSYEVRDVPVGPTKVCIIPPITTGVGPAVRPRDRERGLRRPCRSRPSIRSTTPAA